MNTTKEKEVDAAAQKKAEFKKLKKACEDLVNAPTFAEKLGVSVQLIYNALKDGRIKPEDIIVICNHDHWSFKKYKHLTFRPRKH